jgi:hypothetical protein
MSHLKSLGLPLLVLALSLSITTAAQAQSRQKKTQSPFAQQIKALHQANELMKKADHDYQGHRVKAMKEVHNAIQFLREGSAAPKKKKGQPGTKPGTGGGLPQDQSDALLKQAATQIQAVQNSLANVQDTRAVQATAALQRALQELQTALQIK